MWPHMSFYLAYFHDSISVDNTEVVDMIVHEIDTLSEWNMLQCG